MEVLKDYPKEFAKLFQPSFSFLSKINITFLFGKGFVEKYWRFLYIIPCLVIHYGTLGFNVAKLVGQGHEFASLMPAFLVYTQAFIKFILLMTKISLITTIIKELGTLWRTNGLNEVQIKARDALLKRVRVCNGALVFVSVYTGAELITITLCALLGVEFILLSEDMLNVKPEWKTISEETNEGLDNEATREEMSTIKDIVERHQKLFVLSTQLDEAFNQMIFVDLIFIGLTTCFCQFAAQAQFSRGPTYMVNYYIAMINFLFYVLYLCYYGDFLMKASLRIGDMAFHSLWYKGDYQYQKTIVIIIMRSQKPCCLTSLKYAPITLNTFTKVMSTTWSYFSVMNTAFGGEN